MSARYFSFRVDDKPAFAQGHVSGRVSIAVGLTGNLGMTIWATAAEARAMAVALEAAATWAENVLETGLGESAVDAPAVAS
jgi:D-serine dehydratase